MSKEDLNSVKICDFALAQELNLQTHYVDGGAAGIYGAVNVMAPEVLRKKPSGRVSLVFNKFIILARRYMERRSHPLHDCDRRIPSLLHLRDFSKCLY